MDRVEEELRRREVELAELRAEAKATAMLVGALVCVVAAVVLIVWIAWSG